MLQISRLSAYFVPLPIRSRLRWDLPRAKFAIIWRVRCLIQSGMTDRNREGHGMVAASRTSKIAALVIPPTQGR
ncbi:MAG: hypothetical protein ABJP45_19200 [Cyclobacteriaceae bacterium]